MPKRSTQTVLAFEPCHHMPGSQEKIDTFTQRIAQGFPLFHPEDSYDVKRDGHYDFNTIKQEQPHVRRPDTDASDESDQPDDGDFGLD